MTTNKITTLIPVPFHGHTLFIVEHDGEPYVVMKAIVEALGLDWSSQYTKLMNNTERWGSVILELPSIAISQSKRQTLCMPLRKFTGWINTLNVNKVGNAIRRKIAVFQRESDDALWAYWDKGFAHNPRVLAPDPAVAQVLTMDGLQILLIHDASNGLTVTTNAAEAFAGLSRGMIRKLSKRDPAVKAAYRLLCGEQLDAYKRVLGLPSTVNIQATITVPGLEHVLSLIQGGSRGRRIMKLLQRAGATSLVEAGGHA